MYWLMNNLFPTSVGINTFITIMLLALTKWWSASDNIGQTHLPHPLPHLAWRPSCFYQSKNEMRHGPMVHEEGDGPASEGKIA